MAIIKMNEKGFLKYFTIIIILVIVFVLICYATNFYGDTIEGLEKLTETQLIDMQKNNDANIKQMLDFKQSWCSNSGGLKLESGCQKMQRGMCSQMSCCIWANRKGNNKCVAGGITGPMFGEKPRRYFFQGTCYKNDGTKC